MHLDEFREYCLKKPGVSEELPFDEYALVFKVMGKIFSITNIELFQSINLKCDPERALELRERYDGVTPGYHMNKKHWNTVMTDGSVPEELLYDLIDHSYQLVVDKLPQKLKTELNTLHES